MISRKFLVSCCCLMLVTTSLCSWGVKPELVAKLPQPSACVFSGEFFQKKSLIGISEPLESSGVFLHHCKHGVIWQTLSPVKDVLLVSNEQRMYNLEDGQLVKLNARASKMIASLIKGLMGGDSVFIGKNFIFSSFSADQEKDARILLTPKKRRLKKAIQSVELLRPILQPHLTLISLLDTKGQATELIADEKMIYDDNATSSICKNTAIDIIACRALFSSLEKNNQPNE